MGDLLHRQAGLRLVILAAGLAWSGCDDPASGSEPDARFSTLQAEIFTPKCTLSSCHSAAFHAGELVLEAGTAHADLTEGPVLQAAAASEGRQLVVPGDAAASFLWMKLQPGLDARYGVLMPQGSTQGLPDEDLALIERWIEAGAQAD
jgi:hypothetical protein